MGDVMAQNKNGTLVRIDHTNTYEGTATAEDGAVLKKKFRCSTREEAIDRWQSWQKGKEEKMAKSETKGTMGTCPFTGSCHAGCQMWDDTTGRCAFQDIGFALFGIYKVVGDEPKAIGRIADALEMIALQEKPAKESDWRGGVYKPDAKNLIEDYLSEADGYDFINMKSKDVYSGFRVWLANKGVKPEDFPTQQMLTFAVQNKFPDILSYAKAGGGMFVFAKSPKASR